MDIEKFKLVLALEGYVLVQEPTIHIDYEPFYAAIFDAADGTTRATLRNMPLCWSFSETEEEAFNSVYEQWKEYKKNL